MAPISQATILMIYGELNQLVSDVETVRKFVREPDMFLLPAEVKTLIDQNIEELATRAREAQKTAIDAILSDEPGLQIHPLTGKLDGPRGG